MSRVLVLSGSHLCQNPRALKEATTLAAAGYDVTLLHVSVRADLAATDERLMSGQSFRRETLDLVRPVPGFLARLRTRLARAATRRLGRSSASALGPARALLARARTLTSDLLIAHTEVPLWVAQQLRGEGRRVAVDLEDWYSEDLLPADRSARPLELLRVAERFALHHAASVSVPSGAMARALHTAYAGNPAVVVRNSFPLQPDHRVLRPPSARPRLVWFSQTIGPGRGLEAFLALWHRLEHAPAIQLIGRIRPGYREQLLSNIPGSHHAALHFEGPVPPETLPSRLADFDVGLALEAQVPPSRDTTITNKILQYLNAGLALIATPTAGQREVLAQAPGAGVLLPGDPTAGVELLRGFLSSAESVRSAQVAARAAAEREFCWEKESPRLIAAVTAALAHRPAAS